MTRPTNNASEVNNSTLTSTPIRAKSVPRTVSLSTYGKLKSQNEKLKERLAYKGYFAVSIRAVGTWSEDYKSGLYISRIIQAASKDEAIGLLCNHIKTKFPSHSILAREISCESYNIANPKI